MPRPKRTGAQPKQRAPKKDANMPVYLVTEQCELLLSAPFDQVLSYVKQDDIRTRFGGATLLVLKKVSDLKVEEPNKAFKAAADLLKQGWAEAEVCKLLGLSSIPTQQAAPEQPKAEEPTEIPTNWEEETKITTLRKYVAMLLPDEDVSKWNKDACKATLNKMLTTSKEVKELVQEDSTDEVPPWEGEAEVEAKVEETIPEPLSPPPLPPNMPQSPIAPPPLVPPPAQAPTTPAPPIAPMSKGGAWAPPPIPSPFRKQ